MIHITNNKEYSIQLLSKGCDIKKYPQLGKKYLTIQGRDIIHAIITCGMPVDYLTYSHLHSRRKEFLYKQYMMEATLKVDKGELVKDIDSFEYLDSSEKNVISYYYGMIFTKLISRKIFNIDFLVHLSLFKRLYGKDKVKVKFKSTEMPDFIGHNNAMNEWSVWEAKGNRDGLKKGFVQVQAINKINGKKPYLKAVNATYFTKKENKLKSYILDPDGDGEINLEIDMERLYDFYYRPLFEFIRECNGKLNNEIMEATFVDDGQNELFTIGLPELIYNHFAKQEKNLEQKILVCKEQLFKYDNMYGDLVYLC